ncbi:MAG: 2OG-Fe(II) oxygenase [Gammaproteobacteria bacterium]|nr:2OG-Fe(II) oxygenase [Gammaproteobacteria bacterium]
MQEHRIVTALATHGYCVVPHFFADTDALRDALLIASDAGALHRAGVGKGPQQQVRDEVRGDYVMWLEPSSTDPALRTYFDAMEALRLAINHHLYMGLFEYEAHFALYPPGAFYQKHLDGFVGDKRRKVSCVLYLNEEWQPEFGGHLRLYTTQGTLDIPPDAGTLVCFLSDDLWHEVRPATRTRLSVTGWFKIRPLP